MATVEELRRLAESAVERAVEEGRTIGRDSLLGAVAADLGWEPNPANLPALGKQLEDIVTLHELHSRATRRAANIGPFGHLGSSVVESVGPTTRIAKVKIDSNTIKALKETRKPYRVVIDVNDSGMPQKKGKAIVGHSA